MPVATLLACAVLASAPGTAAETQSPPQPAGQADGEASPPEATDPTQQHRWHMPRRGARKLAPAAVGPVHAEWNRLGHLVNAGKSELRDWGITFDVDLTFFDQQASRVESGRKNFGTFSWRIMGDAKLFDLRDSDHLSGLGRGSISWNTFGTAGLNYDPSEQTLSGNLGSISTLNATVFDSAAIVDELFWKQVTWGGKLLVLGGKIDMLYHFDTNRVANDAYSQFFSYALQNNPSIPGPLYGGFGAIVRANLPRSTYLMFGVGDSSMDRAVAPWETLDNHSWYQLLELGLSPSVPVLGKGNYRITPWHNHLFGEDGYGIGLSLDQELGRKDLVAFFRFGYGDKDVTPVETFVSGGIGLEAPFGRSGDLAAIGVAWSDPSPGSGDRDETLVEILYRVGLAKGISITPDLQLVFDPADGADHDFVVVPGIRLHLVF
jgi:carbohydrate-selective porin OprB